MASSAPPVVAILLAAGRSSQMGGRNKLLLDVHGEPMRDDVADPAV